MNAEHSKRPLAQLVSSDESFPARAPFSVVIPAFNEGEGLRRVVDEIRGAIERLDPMIEAEIIVVDDGSTDGTAAVLEALDHENVRVIRHHENRGYGAAIKTGVHHARHDWIVITDADGTYPAVHLGELLSERGRYDMVVGARIGANAKIEWIRRIPKWALTRLAAYLSQVRIPDLNSGFRVMRRDLIEKFERILSNKFSFTTTITLALLSSGYQLKYVTIDYRKRSGRSKIRPFADTLNFLTLIIRTIMYFNPLRLFIPVAALFFVASIGVGLGSYFALGKLMDVTTVLLFVTSVQLLATGMLADVINRRNP